MIDLKKQVLYMSDEDIWELRDWILEAVRLMERATDYLHLPGTQELSRQLSEHVKKIQL